MRAQRARCDAVNSYKSESSFVSLLIRADELAFYEAGVGVKGIVSPLAAPGIDSCTTEVEVNLTNKPTEVGYSGWIASFRMGPRTVCRHRGTINWAREIDMQLKAKGARLRVWNREGPPAPASVILIGVCSRGCPKPRTEGGTGSQRSVNQVSSRHSSAQKSR